ncbi:nucleotidyltransferase domain-containing protein [Patescibacteria group bacterium]|nr:nucleotidyltransferase domain-containing protein [Patescibacteria group bacterium]MBU4511705.1 nucleotidyltransferase domain-containing protein [Patescibacteria group bacterium]MCG2692960.1 nucleotidyltransferase domain-containing protein [Candidatus Parcubacteria bacterium]
MSSKNRQLAKKKRALNYFKGRILNRAKKDDIAKIYLFGSLAREKVREDSDIDILIFSRKEKDRRLEDIIDETAFDTVVKYGESVEPLIYSFKDFKFPKSAFLKRVILDGRELYSTII